MTADLAKERSAPLHSKRIEVLINTFLGHAFNVARSMVGSQTVLLGQGSHFQETQAVLLTAWNSSSTTDMAAGRYTAYGLTTSTHQTAAITGPFPAIAINEGTAQRLSDHVGLAVLVIDRRDNALMPQIPR